MRSNLVMLVLISSLAAAGCDLLPGGDKGQETGDTSSQQGAATSQNAYQTPPALPQDTLATVGGVPITKQELEMRIQELKDLFTQSGREWQNLTQEQMQGLLNDLVTAEIVAQSAVKQGLDNTLEAKRSMAYLRRNYLSELWFEKVSEETEVSSSEVESFYEQNKQGFQEPERVKVSQIIVDTREEAKSLLAQLLTGQLDFAAAARQHSQGPTADQGGEIPIDLMRGADLLNRYGNIQTAQQNGVVSLEPGLESAVFSIASEGDVSSVVQGPDGRFHLYRLDERIESQQRELDEIWDNINNGLKLQKIQQMVESQRAQAKIEQFPERLQDVVQ